MLTEPGRRDRYVMVQERSGSEGASGRPVETWNDLAYVWMARQDAQGTERFRASQNADKFDTRWEIPYRADMDPERVNVPKERRLVYAGRVYDIVAANMTDGKDNIILMTIASSHNAR